MSEQDQVQAARKAFGQRLRALRLDANLNGRQLSARSGMRDSKISRIELGRQNPTEDDIRVWCRACAAEDQVPELIAAHRQIDEMWEAARHIPGVSGHELSMAANRHFSIPKLNEAIADVVNAHARLDMSRVWGNGTHMDTYLNNLLAETSVRYGKPGGIAYHHVADTYIALFTRFIPCGAWEAVYIIDGLLQNASEVKPTTIHADTQGQSFPVFTLAHLLGFELMPRIRNWKDLTFYRPGRATRYRHIDALFGERGKNVIDWTLIETHFRDLLRVAVSIRENAISSTLLLRRLRSGSRKNAHYAAFREVGRVIRTVQLLRYLSVAPLRRRVTAATNKVEAYNGFAEWLHFGQRGVIADNDPIDTMASTSAVPGRGRWRRSATGGVRTFSRGRPGGWRPRWLGTRRR
ncbi:Tn3 family transposase [Nonomuraea sp. NPDC052129]|uniref:Tn3 family transposase n=1 Tax=Nonomuraea sp. NPDC052129 TaxID=3154651 RepID=UPI00341F1B37